MTKALASVDPLVTAVYCRISKDDEQLGLGVDRQRRDCLAFCARHGWAVGSACIYVDNDRSASKRDRKARPDFERLISAVAAGTVGRVVVVSLERLYRDTRELEDLIDLAESARVELVPVTMGNIDLRTADGRMLARVYTGIARGEAEKIQERVRRKHLELAEAGKAHGGRRPYGFEADKVTIRPGEAEMVREAARRIVAGESARSVALDWNARGIPAAAGGRWTPNQLRQMVTSPRMIGKRVHRGEIVADGEWQAILDEVTWKRIVRRYASSASAVDLSTRSRKYLLSGLLTCGVPGCGHKLAGRPRNDGKPRYFCPPDRGGCGKLTVLMEPVDDYVRKVAYVALNDPGFIDRLAARAGGSASSELADALATDQDALRELTDDYYVHRLIGRDQFISASRELEARIAATKKAQEAGLRLEALQGLIGQGDALEGLWAGLTLARKQAILALIFERLVIQPVGKAGRAGNPADRIEWELAVPLSTQE